MSNIPAIDILLSLDDLLQITLLFHTVDTDGEIDITFDELTRYIYYSDKANNTLASPHNISKIIKENILGNIKKIIEFIIPEDTIEDLNMCIHDILNDSAYVLNSELDDVSEVTTSYTFKNIPTEYTVIAIHRLVTNIRVDIIIKRGIKKIDEEDGEFIHEEEF